MYPFRRFTLSAFLSLGLLAGPGCVGNISTTADDRSPDKKGPGTGPGDMTGGELPPGPGGGTGGTGGMVTPGGPPDPAAAGPMPLRRLTRREYNNTVRDLLGDTTRPADSFPPDRGEDFIFRQAGLVTSLDAGRYREAAEALGALAEKNVATLVPCAAAGDAACARQFIEGFGLRAYRRPLVAAETDRLMKLYEAGRAGNAPFAAGVRLVVEGMLQSPSFLYRWELGNGAPVKDGKVLRLGGYEIASRLSYFLWGSMPDQALFDAAAGNRLATEADVEREAKRLLGDPRAKEAVRAFFNEWLNLDEVTDRPKDDKLYPEWKEDLKTAMEAETRMFIDHVVFEGDSKLATLLGASFSFVNAPLAKLYGAPAAGATLTRAELNADQRAGLLTQAAFLTVHGSTDGSNPIVRGKAVFERLLCGTLPPPPPDVPPPKPPSAGGTTRERFAEHSTNKCASGCHGLFDGFGFAFEHYDGIGKYRTTDNNKPVDAKVNVSLDDKNHDAANARELALLLAGSAQAQRCFATQWARFAWNRPDTDADRASIDSMMGTFRNSGFSIRDLLVSAAKSRSFRYRSLSAGEM